MISKHIYTWMMCLRHFKQFWDLCLAKREKYVKKVLKIGKIQWSMLHFLGKKFHFVLEIWWNLVRLSYFNFHINKYAKTGAYFPKKYKKLRGPNTIPPFFIYVFKLYIFHTNFQKKSRKHLYSNVNKKLTKNDGKLIFFSTFQKFNVFLRNTYF